MRADGWRHRIGDRIVRRPRQRELEPRRIRGHRRHRVLIPPAASALLSLGVGFAVLIGIGTVLLSLPASADGERAGFIDALFTSTSAVCVTGLVVVNSGEFWSGFGQTVILLLMLIGGLGIMTAGLVILTAIGRRITLNQRLIVRDTLGGTSLGGVMAFGRYVIIFALAVQAAGFLLLFVRLLFDYPVAQAAWDALFHSVSAFNNAGFTIFDDSASLSAFQGDPITLAIFAVMIVLGSLSFPVVNEIVRRKRPNRWALDTRLVIVGTLGLWVAGAVSMLLFEIGNPATLGQMSTGDQVSNAAFQAVTARTAGFSTIDFSATRSGNDFLYMLLMFIGGASGSTAGGIKVNTMMVLAVAGLASINGRSHAEIFGRELPYGQIARALAVVLLALMTLFVAVVALAISEGDQIDAGTFGFLDVLFEAVSAFGTVGLSRGITPDLTDPGKVVVTLAMYLGRLGPLTIGLGLALRERRAVYRFAQERIRIG